MEEFLQERLIKLMFRFHLIVVFVVMLALLGLLQKVMLTIGTKKFCGKN